MGERSKYAGCADACSAYLRSTTWLLESAEAKTQAFARNAGMGMTAYRDARSGGVFGGSFRHFVACSYPYASLMRRDSSKARPRIDIPAGSVLFRVYPIGTVIAGIPVVGENTWLLSPAGVLRSPISRGTLLHVG